MRKFPNFSVDRVVEASRRGCLKPDIKGSLCPPRESGIIVNLGSIPSRVAALQPTVWLPIIAPLLSASVAIWHGPAILLDRFL
jgi:hypothetical protein